MNVPDINRSILRMHVAAIEAKYPIKIIGVLPRGSVGHMYDKDNAIEFLAEKRGGNGAGAQLCPGLAEHGKAVAIGPQQSCESS